MSKPLLSIIIPTFNEETALPLLLEDLSCQQGVVFEVVVCDGASTDKTVALAEAVFSSGQLPGKVVQGGKGRGLQLNQGMAHTSGDWLLFLHADSRLPEELQLCQAVQTLECAQAEEGKGLIAGRFPLSFDLPNQKDSLPYYFYETKARLGRPGCIHGDQGFLFRRSDFMKVGPFREDLPVMEDTWLAEAVRQRGRWLLLPGEVRTSSRRFQTEGFNQRQLLNALLMNFLFIDCREFFREVPLAYRAQGEAERLNLFPFFVAIRELLRSLPIRRRWQIWQATGRYVRSQAWQLGLLKDCRRNFARQLRPAEGPMSCLGLIDRWFEPLTDHRPGHLVTAVLVRLWFSLTLRRLQKQHL